MAFYSSISVAATPNGSNDPMRAELSLHSSCYAFVEAMLLATRALIANSSGLDELPAGVRAPEISSLLLLT